ncbi:MAG TPA: RES domain-containing protein [Longimicrobiaceae bacterium]|nr:RES domain-containing protein [Longimicrobiaceae bacterium]
MPTVYRVAKARYPVFDGTGAYLEGGRWNSPGRPVVYGSTCLAGCLLEILVHAGRLQKVPGAHHCARAEIPDDLPVEVVDEARLPGWELEESSSARAYGDAWLAEGRTAVLSVPAAAARPLGRNLLLNPAHPDYPRIRVHAPAPISWDARLFRV